MHIKYYFIFIFSFVNSPIALAAIGDNKIPITEGQGIITVTSIIQILLSLIFVILLIIFASWLYRKYGNFSSSLNEKFKVVTGISLGAKEKVILMQVGDEQILIGIAPGMIRKIHTLEECITFSSNEHKTGAKASFLDRLNGELLKYKKI